MIKNYYIEHISAFQASSSYLRHDIMRKIADKSLEERKRKVDLNGLISTIITATAALVAIIGGFLVSRVITLAGEKQSIERRLQEIDNDLTIKKEMLENIEKVIFEEDIDDFIQNHCEELIIEGKSLEEILRDDDSCNFSEEDLKPYVEELITIRDKTIEMIEKSEDLPSDFTEFINDNGIQIEGKKSWYELVYKIIRKNVLGTGFLYDLEPPVLSIMDAQTYREKVKYRDELRNEVYFLSVRKNEQQKILNDYVKPYGLWSGLAVLIYSCIVGIAYPCILLPYPEETYNDVKTKWLLISLFFSALIAIFIYLAVSMHKLTRRKQDPKPDK